MSHGASAGGRQAKAVRALGVEPQRSESQTRAILIGWRGSPRTRRAERSLCYELHNRCAGSGSIGRRWRDGRGKPAHPFEGRRVRHPERTESTKQNAGRLGERVPLAAGVLITANLCARIPGRDAQAEAYATTATAKAARSRLTAGETGLYVMPRAVRT
jgi:hypothetical protein